MNYQKIYNQIIENRKQNEVEGYTEKHHIIPRSLGGTDENENLVVLTAREHFLCHFLLAKMYEKESFEWYKMNNAFLIMKCSSTYHNRYFNSRLYEALKKNFSSVMSLIQSGKSNSQYGTMWICNIELQENKKIRKDEEIPESWVKGRNVWNKIKENNKSKKIIKEKPYRICPCCFEFFKQKNMEKCCSIKCSKIMMSKPIKVSIDNIIFKSITEAANAMDINKETARLRFKSKNFPTWKIL